MPTLSGDAKKRNNLEKLKNLAYAIFQYTLFLPVRNCRKRHFLVFGTCFKNLVHVNGKAMKFYKSKNVVMDLKTEKLSTVMVGLYRKNLLKSRLKVSEDVKMESYDECVTKVQNCDKKMDYEAVKKKWDRISKNLANLQENLRNKSFLDFYAEYNGFRLQKMDQYNRR